MSGITVDPVREKILQDNRKKLIEHKEISSRLKGSKYYIFKLTYYCFNFMFTTLINYNIFVVVLCIVLLYSYWSRLILIIYNTDFK